MIYINQNIYAFLGVYLDEFRFANQLCLILVANSAGGCAFEREVIPPDWVLDYWHPLEKAQYPEYFARREQRKKEYVMWWEKQYGKPDPNAHHH